MSNTTNHPLVVNVRTAPRDTYIYVGRNCVRFKGVGFGNPFKEGMDPFVAKRLLAAAPSEIRYSIRFSGLLDRDKSIECYRHWLMAQPNLVARARKELKGKKLGCWCAPLACHADVLAEVANQ